MFPIIIAQRRLVTKELWMFAYGLLKCNEIKIVLKSYEERESLCVCGGGGGGGRKRKGLRMKERKGQKQRDRHIRK